LLWLLNKTFLPLLYRISDFRVKNLDEKLLKVLMDAIDIIQRVLELGYEPAIRVKKTFRMKIRHPVKKLSMENWKRYGGYRYRIEPLFGSIKLKLGSSLMGVRFT